MILKSCLFWKINLVSKYINTLVQSELLDKRETYYGTKKTYHDFLKQIDEAARAMKAIGVKHKDVVSICLPNTPEGIISFYAVNKIGAIASMIHPLSAENEMTYLKYRESDNRLW